MTLLSICQNASNYIPVAPPSTIVNNNDQTASLLLAAAQLTGMELSRRPPGGWVSMIEEFDFQTSATGQVTGTIANTGSGGLAQITVAQNAGNNTLLAPLLSDWTNSLSLLPWIAQGTGLINNTQVTAIASISGGTQYLISVSTAATQTGSGTYDFGKSDYTLPADFERAVDNTFWDRTRYWAMRGPLSPQQWQIYKSSVIGKATIQRRYRFREIAGQQRISIDPTPFDNGSNLVFEYVSNGWCQSSGGTRQTQWQADTDTGILDEYLIQLGVIWRMLRRLGLAYSDELAEYERQVDKAMSQDGAAAILDLTPNDHLTLLGPWNTPETNFGNVLN